jgi:hypothetical protein
MDIILLPQEIAAAEIPWLFTDEGRLRFERLMSWLSSESVQFDVYAFLPGGSGAAEERTLDLLAAARHRARRAFVLVTVASVTPALLAALELRSIENMLLLASDDTLDQDKEALRVVEEHIAAKPNTSLLFGAWLKPAPGTANFHKTRLYSGAGISPAVINPPAFTLPSAGEAHNGQASPPEELLGGVFGCELYSNTLTLDGQGNVRACPRDESVNPDMGSLVYNPAEDLVVRRGRCSHLAGRMPMCRACGLRGRFSWAQQKTPKLTALFLAGKERTGVPSGPLSTLEAIPQRDLAVASSEELEKDLHAFEERLAAWSQGMEKWEADSGQ